MMEDNSPIMTLEKTAKYLKIEKSTLYKMATYFGYNQVSRNCK